MENSKVLLRIHKILSDMSVDWIAIGSLALSLYNILPEETELDILISTDKHLDVHTALARESVTLRPPTYLETKYFVANVSYYLMDLVSVKVYSGLIIKLKEGLINPSFAELLAFSNTLSHLGAKIFVAPLEWLYLYYLAYPYREEIIESVLKEMFNRGVNVTIIDELVKNLPRDVKEAILSKFMK